MVTVWIPHAIVNLVLAESAREYHFDMKFNIETEVGFAGTELDDEELLRFIPHFRNHWDLPRIDLSDTEITDYGLRQLRDLPNLRWLDVRNTDVSADGIADARRSLPNVVIEF